MKQQRKTMFLRSHMNRSKDRPFMITVEVSFMGRVEKEIAIAALTYHKMLIVKIGGMLFATYHFDSPDSNRKGYFHLDVTHLTPAHMMGMDKELTRSAQGNLLESLPEVTGHDFIMRGYIDKPLKFCIMDLIKNPA